MPMYERHNNAFRFTREKRLYHYPHRHREIEMILMQKGSAEAYVDGTNYKISEGDALLVFPNQLHYYTSSGTEECILVLIPPSIYSDYDEAIKGHRPSTALVKGGAFFEDIRLFTSLCLDKMTKYSLQRRKCIIGSILGSLLEHLPLVEVMTNNSALERILIYCDSHYHEDLDLDKMSKELLLGKYYISHLFSCQLGISFRDYINTLRVECAIKLLSDSDLTITEIGYSSGFSCTRSFNRAFVKLTGISPRDYRRKHQSEGDYT